MALYDPAPPHALTKHGAPAVPAQPEVTSENCASAERLGIQAEQARNLEQLAAYLEQLPATYAWFGMNDYLRTTRSRTTAWRAENPEKCLTYENPGECGAVACAVGHGVAAGVPVPEECIQQSTLLDVGEDVMNWEHYAQQQFGARAALNRAQTEDGWPLTFGQYMFGSMWASVDNTPHGAAARIRKVLAEGFEDEIFTTDFDRRGRLAMVRAYAPYRVR